MILLGLALLACALLLSFYGYINTPDIYSGNANLDTVNRAPNGDGAQSALPTPAPSASPSNESGQKSSARTPQ
jgi:hypothetical protein